MAFALEADGSDHIVVRWSIVFLLVLNSFGIFISLGILGGGIFLWTSLNGTFQGVLSETVVIGVCVMGVVVLFVCILGAFGAYRKNKKMLFAYVGLVLALFAASIAAIVLLGQYTDNLKTDPKVHDFVLSSYVTCCVDNEKFCDATAVVVSDPGFCEPMFSCSNALSNSSSTCFEQTVPPSDQPFVIDASICTFLALVGVVGVVETGSTACGNGNASAYSNDFVAFVTDNARFAVIGVGILVGILGMASVTSFILLCFAPPADENARVGYDATVLPMAAVYEVPLDDVGDFEAVDAPTFEFDENFLQKARVQHEDPRMSIQSDGI